MIYLDSTMTLKLKFGEVKTTTEPDWHVFYSKPTIKQSREEITQVDSYDIARGAMTAPATTALSILTGPALPTNDVNVATSSARYVGRVVICNRDTVSRTAYLYISSTLSDTYILSGVSISAGGTLTLGADGSLSTVGSSSFSADNSTLEIVSNTIREKDGGTTDAKLANMGARSVKGRSANSSGVPADISFASSAGKFLGDRGSALGAFYPTQILSKSSSYPLVTDDYGATVLCTAALTVTLPAPGTVGSGWWVKIKKTVASGSDVTIARNASETIDGRSVSDVLKAQYATATYITDGTNWHVVEANDWMQASRTTDASVPGTGVSGLDHLLAIPPGEWDLSFVCFLLPNGATITSAFAFIGTATGDNTTGLLSSDNTALIVISGTSNTTGVVPSFRLLSTANPDNRYFKMNVTYTVATPNYRYRFSARRVG